MENSPIATNSTISQNDFKEATAILRFEVPLKKGQGNNVIYFPDLINPPKESTNDQKIISMDDFSSDQHLEDEMALENFVVSETAEFLEHMAIEKRPEPKFYAISRKNTTPGFFGAGTNINPPENILQFFKNEQSNNDKSIAIISSNIDTIENNENKIVNKPKSRRKNATATSKSKSKKTIKQDEKLAVVNETVASSSTSSSKKTKRQPSQYSETKTKKQKTKAKVQRLLEKHKRRKEKKITKDASTSSVVSGIISSGSTSIAKSSKSVEDTSSLSSSSSSSIESSPNRKDRPDGYSRSSSTSSTVTSTKAGKVNTKPKADNQNNYNAESSTSTLPSDSTQC